MAVVGQRIIPRLLPPRASLESYVTRYGVMPSSKKSDRLCIFTKRGVGVPDGDEGYDHENDESNLNFEFRLRLMKRCPL